MKRIPYPHPSGSPFSSDYQPVLAWPEKVKKAPVVKSGRPPGRPKKIQE